MNIVVPVGCFQYVIVDHTKFVDCSTLVTNFCTLVTHFALWFGISCTQIDQSQSSIIAMYIIIKVTNTTLCMILLYSLSYLVLE